MYIYVVDQRVEMNSSVRRRVLENRPQPKEVIYVNREWSIDRICRRIRSFGNDSGIFILYLLGHGFPFGRNQEGGTPEVEIGQGLRMFSVNRFSMLRNIWIGNHPRIEVHSCYMVSEELGQCRNRTWSENFMERYHDRGAYWRGERVARAHDCTAGRLGSTAPGNMLMQALANASGVTVVASADAQHIDVNWEMEGQRRWYPPVQEFLR